MTLSPMICGAWDGVSAWLQWTPCADRYRVQVRYRKAEADGWGAWQEVVLQQGAASAWGVLPTWKQGWWVQARVSLDGESWELAQEVDFARCRAEFELSSDKHRMTFLPSSQIAAYIDGAACIYTFPERIELLPGETRKTWLTAAISSGYCQLDHAGDFDIRPAYGVRIRNTGESVEDVTPTGRDCTRIAARPPDGPVTLAVVNP